MELKVIAQSDYKRATWKNGLGFTDEIAIFPENASLKEGNFLWRVSSARIEKASPFSEFAHHDRTLVILKGQGIRLFHTYEPGEEPELVDLSTFEPYEFPGDVPSRCELIAGAVTDLSIFVRKAEAEAMTEVRELDSSGEDEWIPAGRWNFAFAARGSFEIGSSYLGQELSLKAGDTLQVRLDSPLAEGEAIRFRSVDGPGILVFVSIQG